jgi:argininosuccinate synthase
MTPKKIFLPISFKEHVTGWVRLKLYKGNVTTVARGSPLHSLYDADIVTFEETAGGSETYDHRDAAGFIRLNALALRILAARNRRIKAAMENSVV